MNKQAFLDRDRKEFLMSSSRLPCMANISFIAIGEKG